MLPSSPQCIHGCVATVGVDEKQELAVHDLAPTTTPQAVNNHAIEKSSSRDSISLDWGRHVFVKHKLSMGSATSHDLFVQIIMNLMFVYLRKPSQWLRDLSYRDGREKGSEPALRFQISIKESDSHKPHKCQVFTSLIYLHQPAQVLETCSICPNELMYRTWA